MGRGDQGKGSASSSAKAAEALAAKSAQPVGFGGFSGTRRVSAAFSSFGGVTRTEASDPRPAPSPVDSELVQYLKHLSKKDSTTKLKALQALRVKLKEKGCDEAQSILPSWIFSYKVLVMDTNRTVRAEASATLGDLVVLVGRHLSPQLKGLIGAWWMAQFDPFPEAAGAARGAFQSAFPHKKRADALLFCHKQILTYLKDNFTVAPQQLGDARKDSPEEVEDRYERVLVASVLALGSLAEVAAMVKGDESVGDAKEGTAEEVLLQVQELVFSPGFLKKTLMAKQAPVRRASYVLVRTLATCHPSTLSDLPTELCTGVLGAFTDKDSSNHGTMWEMMLTFCRAYPSCWNKVNLNKAILPRWYAFLRHGCYGSGTQSYPALLPLLALLPGGEMDNRPTVAAGILDNLWLGARELPAGIAGRTSRSAASSAYQELLLWALTRTPPEGQGPLLNDTLDRHLLSVVLHLPLIPQPTRELATEVLCGLINKVSGLSQSQPDRAQDWHLLWPTLEECFNIHVCGQGEVEEAKLQAAESFVFEVMRHCGRSAAARLARPLAQWLGGVLQSQNHVFSQGATALMAKMIRAFGASILGSEEVGADGEGVVNQGMGGSPSTRSSFNLPSLLGRLINSGADEGGSISLQEEEMDLVLSCVLSREDSRQAWREVTDILMGTPSLGGPLLADLLIRVVVTHEDEELEVLRQGALDQWVQEALSAGPRECPNTMLTAVEVALGANGRGVPLVSPRTRSSIVSTCVEQLQATVGIEGHDGESKVLSLLEAAVMGGAVQDDEVVVRLVGALLKASWRIGQLGSDRRQPGMDEWGPESGNEASEEDMEEVEDEEIGGHGGLAPGSPGPQSGSMNKPSDLVDRHRASWDEFLSFWEDHRTNMLKGLGPEGGRLLWSTLVDCLVEVLRGIVEGGGLPEDLGEWDIHDGAGASPRTMVEDVFEVLVHEAQVDIEQDGVVALTSQLVDLCDDWERWCTRRGQIVNPARPPCQSNKVILEALTSLLHYVPVEFMAGRCSLLTEKRISGFGPWLAVELLCGCLEAGSALTMEAVDVTQEYLLGQLDGDPDAGDVAEQSTPESDLASTSMRPPLEASMFDDFVELVLEGCRVHGTASLYGQVLTGSLNRLASRVIDSLANGGVTAGARYVEQLTRQCLLHGEGSSEINTLVLSATAPCIRAAGCQAVERAHLGPWVSSSVAQLLHGSRNQVFWGDIEQLLVCFPVKDSLHGAPGSQRCGSTLPEERRALLALLRYLSTEGKNPPRASGPVAGEGLLTWACLVAVLYCWEEMGPVEWAVVLEESQQALLRSFNEMMSRVERLVEVTRKAARSIMASNEDVEGPVAVAFLGGLHRRGVAVQQSAVQHMTTELGTLMDDWEDKIPLLPVARGGTAAGLLLLETLISLKEEIQKTRTTPPNLTSVLQECAGRVLSTAVLVGGLLVLVAPTGPAGTQQVLQWVKARSTWWESAKKLQHHCTEETLRYRVLGALDQRLSTLGLDTVSCLLGLWWAPQDLRSLQKQQHRRGPSKGSSVRVVNPALDPICEVAYRLLLQPFAISKITFAERDAAAVSDSLVDLDQDPPGMLVSTGVRPDMVPVLMGSNDSPCSPPSLPCYFVFWSLLLAHLMSLPSSSLAQRQLCQSLRDVPDMVGRLLDQLVERLSLKNTAVAGLRGPGHRQLGTTGGSTWQLGEDLLALGLPSSPASYQHLARLLYRAVLRTLPASARLWFSDLRDRARASAVEAYTQREESEVMILQELQGVKAAEYLQGGNFMVKANTSAREMVAVMEIEDGANLELVIKLPACAPLKPAEVFCRRNVGVSETQLRKWLLSINVFLRNQNRSVADAIALWKTNIDKEFEGLQPCLICYSIISSVNSQLPRLECRTCRVVFHPACLYKWFKSSGKSQCPHCQSPW